jgi:hypothetical protein
LLLPVLRLLLWVSSLSLFTWALLDYRFRDAEGNLRGIFCLPVALGLVLIVLGWAVVGNWRRFGFWLALAVLGQATSLQLIDAGPALHYQHYEPFGVLSTGIYPLLLLVIAAQAAFVSVGFKGRWSKIVAWVRLSFKTWQIAGVGLFFLVSGAAVQRDPSLYIGDLLLAAVVQVLNLGTIVLMVWAMPDQAIAWCKQKIETLFGEKIGHGMDRFVVLATIWVTLAASILNLLSYQDHPHITDEVAYLYQARFFANGAIALPAPPVPQAFDFYLAEIQPSRWFLPTPPGWPAVLAVGMRLGVPWLVNPILAGLNILLAFLLVQELYDRRIARLTVLLLSLSPWYVFMGMNFMTHTFNLTCALAAAVAVIQCRRTGEARWGLAAGAAVGVATLIRPLDGLIVGVLIGLWVIGIGGRRLNWTSLAAFALGALVIGGLVLPFNQLLTGSPLVFPLNRYLDTHFGPGKNDLGFGPRGFDWALQPFSEHNPIAAMINANLNTFSIDVELFGWSIGSLLFVALMLLSGSLRKSDYLMIAVCAAIFVPYFFYYYSGGPDFGARYWFLMLVPLVVLTIRGIDWVQSKIALGNVQAMMAVLLLSAFALATYFPWRTIDKYYHFWGMRPDIPTLAQEHSFGKSLVLIRGKDTHPDFASAAIYNPLDWNADAPVYAWDSSPSVEADLLRAFPDRPVWIVDAPSLTLRGYQVVEGPYKPGDLATRKTAP